MKKLFSYDAETNGLWGQSFSIGAIVTDENGIELSRFVGRCPIEGSVNTWVADNVLPQMAGIPENYPSYRAMLEGFVAFWMAHKEEVSETVTHMGMIVESKIWRDAHDMGIIGDWDAPYITVDVCSFSQVGDSVDTYAKEHGIQIDPKNFAGGTHNPLYDAAVALAVLVDVRK